MMSKCNECVNYARCPCAYDHTVDCGECFEAEQYHDDDDARQDEEDDR